MAFFEDLLADFESTNMHLDNELFVANLGTQIFGVLVEEYFLHTFAAILCKDVNCDGFLVTDFVGVEVGTNCVCCSS